MDKKQLTQTISIFGVLIAVGIMMILVPYRMALPDLETALALQNSLPLVGSALLGAGMVFFLLEMTRLEREKSE